MTTTKFDPVEGKDYSVCSTCGETFATEALSDEHLRLTGPRTNPGVSRSHSVSIRNPSRENRIRNRLDDIVDEAVREATGQFWDLVNADHVTAEEVTKALVFHDDFGDTWREEQA
ncbi:hypothetical protein [Pseudoclavibacter helvolus]|uniref:hypothetical protein n=1 Tax=Pseudoclavibacter helvolus TaxID=255205 RepID=UPI003C783CC0